MKNNKIKKKNCNKYYFKHLLTIKKDFFCNQINNSQKHFAHFHIIKISSKMIIDEKKILISLNNVNCISINYQTNIINIRVTLRARILVLNFIINHNNHLAILMHHRTNLVRYNYKTLKNLNKI